MFDMTFIFFKVEIMLRAYSIKGLSLLTNSKKVGNFLSKWETF